MPDPEDTRQGADDSSTDLRGKVLLGLRWTASVRLAAQALSWVITILVIRVLAPEDYGLNAMVGVIVYLLLLLSTAGIELAIVQAKTLDREQLRRMFGLLLAINLGLCLAQAAIAPLAAAYYQEPRVVPLLLFMALGFLTVPFISVPLALLGREMDFKRIALSELTRNVVASVCTLVMALRGFGVWALLGGQIAGMLAQALLLAVARPWLLMPRFSVRGIESMLRFGGTVALSHIVWVMCWRADAFLGGRILGPELLGVYAVALHLASLPMEKLMPLLHNVAFPAYARIQDKPAEVGRYYLKSVRLVSLVITPLLFGLAAVARWAVPFVLGEKWSAAVLPVVVVSLVIPLRAIANMNTPLLHAVGRPDVTLWNALVTLALLVPAFLIGLRWGVTGLCLAWVVVYPVVFVIVSGSVLRVLNLGWRRFADALVPAAVAGLLMLLAVRTLGALALAGSPPWLVLAVLVPLGAAVYLGFLGLAYRSRLSEVVQLVRARS